MKLLGLPLLPLQHQLVEKNKETPAGFDTCNVEGMSLCVYFRHGVKRTSGSLLGRKPLAQPRIALR